MRRGVCILVLGLVTAAHAKTISINISQKTELRGDTLVVKTTIGNTGDEAAQSVAVNLRFHDKQVRGKRHEQLAPKATFDEELTIATGALGEGRWPYQIAVDYADANLYPFQAILGTAVTVGNPPPAKVSVPEIKATAISDEGSLAVKFKNLAGVARDVSYRIAVPEGLEASEPTGSVRLKAWGDSSTTVRLVNRTALAGSRYPAFVFVEYDDEGVHQSVVAQGMVEIVSPRNFWERYQTVLIAGAALLVALWLVLVARGAMSRKPA